MAESIISKFEKKLNFSGDKSEIDSDWSDNVFIRDWQNFKQGLKEWIDDLEGKNFSNLEYRKEFDREYWEKHRKKLGV